MARAGLIPNLPFSERSRSATADKSSSVVVDRFEESIRQRRARRALHRHDHAELFVLTGGGRLLCDGREFRLADTSLVFIGAGQVHAWLEADDLRGIVIAFSREFAEPVPGGRALWSILFAQGGGTEAATSVPAAQARQVRHAGERLAQEFLAGERGWADMVRAELHGLLTRLVRWQRSGPAAGSPETQLTREFRAALEANFRRLGRVADYGRLLRVTEERLIAAVRTMTGQTPAELWRARVLLEARRCLEYSRLDIAEIAYGLGFKDPSYFARFFRRETGLGPREFRAALRKKHR
jgi:AraC-like DNA-binding protein